MPSALLSAKGGHILLRLGRLAGLAYLELWMPGRQGQAGPLVGFVGAGCTGGSD